MRYNLFVICLMGLSLFGIQFANAQGGLTFHEVKGTVINAADGQPVNGARVQAFNLPRYTTLSDTSGHFVLEIPKTCAILEVTANGYNSLEVPLQGRIDNIVINIYSDIFQADYDPHSRFVNVRKMVDFKHTNALSADDEIELKSSIRTIRRSGTPAMGTAMFINGFHSLYGSSQPLFVVDGLILENQENKLPIHDGYYNNILSAIDIDDIEEITVLDKGTALYGAKGGNGVILIKTKRAHDMVTRIDVNVSAAVDMPANNLPMMDADNFRLYTSDMLGRALGSSANFQFLNDDKTQFNYAKYHNNTNWGDFIYRNALTQKYGVSVRGGDEVAMYNLSLGYSNSQSVLESNNFSRLNIRFNTDLNLVKNLFMRLDVAYSNTKRQLFDDGAPADYTSGSILSTGFLSMIKAPILWPYKYDIFGNPTKLLEDADDYGIALGANNSFSNPLATTEYGTAINKNFQQYDYFSLMFAPRYDITKNLSAQCDVALSFTDETEKYFSPMTGTTAFYLEGQGMVYNHSMSQFIRKRNISVDARLNWHKRWIAHEFSLFGGTRFLGNTYQSNQLSGYNTGSDKMPNITGSLQYRDVNGDDDTWRNLAYYADAQWNLLGKYYLQGTVCMESSSRFGLQGTNGIGFLGVRWGVFPSLQAAWLISSEKFMQSLAFIDQLKWTAGIDVSGNDYLDNYASRTYFQSATFLGNATGIQLGNIGNTGIAWEQTRRLHTGLDIHLFKHRLNITANLFDHYTDNLIALKQLKAISGQGVYWSNDGSMRNRGYDVSLYAKLINQSKFKWDFGCSLGHYENSITSLPDDQSIITSIYGANILTEVNNPAGLFYGYRTDGVFATSSQAAASGLYQRSATGLDEYFQAGDMIFMDKDGNKLINEDDRYVIGNPNPKIYGYFQSRFTYSRWSLHANFKYSYGNDIYNYLRSQLEGGSMIFNQSTAMQRRWVSEGQETDIPRAAYGDPTGNSRFSDRWIEDGSYLKLKKLTLAYDLPLNLEFIRGLNVYACVENLFTLTSYLGTDPESSMNNSVLYQGIDRGLTNSGKSFILGIKISL